MTDFAAQITDLQADFRRISDRDPWVRAAFTLAAGRFGFFGLGRADTDGAGQIASGSGSEFPTITELYALTDRAGSLLASMIPSGRYRWEAASLMGVKYDLQKPWNLWLLFLLVTPPLCFNCWASQPDGRMFVALPQLGKSEVGVWIDDYARVCVSALASLKVGLISSADVSPTPSTPPALTVVDDCNAQRGQSTQAVTDGTQPSTPLVPVGPPDWIKEHFRQQQYRLLTRLWGGKDVTASDLESHLGYTNPTTARENLHRRVTETSNGLREKVNVIGAPWEISRRTRDSVLCYYLHRVGN